ncbi:hypothetical protein F7725_005683 [Dissostichus mawsoni]|uniref:HECT-type E3 ubiquitin transferase n=1 Tax=Dissostichus mawsoni TaxID=36200 RepID=A0A7J5YW48_DISMA|nr:hypothetical protein F7725_005683 [Dissostichus mawsoni]
MPDPFAKVVVDGSGQCHSTDTVRNTLDPKWNQHYDLYIGKADSITISVWNHKKIHKKQGAGFLGCVRLLSNAINRLKTLAVNQRLDLNKLGPNDNDTVRVSLQSRDRIGTGGPVVDCSRLFDNDLPDGWEERRTASGRIQYLNHITYHAVGETDQYSSPSGRPLSCVVDENTPVMTPVNGAEASVPQGVQRVQERRVRSQRHRNYMSRTHLHTPPDLPEGYEQRTTQQGQVYFLHTQTGVSTWHDPRVPSNVNCEELAAAPRLGDKKHCHGSRLLCRPQQPDNSSNASVEGAGCSRGPAAAPLPAQLPEEAECLTVPKYKRDLVQKLKILRQELSAQQPQAGHCRIEVCREEIFEVLLKTAYTPSVLQCPSVTIFLFIKVVEMSIKSCFVHRLKCSVCLESQESYRQVMKMRPKDLWKRLMIKFREKRDWTMAG